MLPRSEELAFYKAVEDKMTLTMNAFLKAGTAMTNMTNVLILLLRMRQACSHPSLVTGSNARDDREGLELVPDTKADGTPAGTPGAGGSRAATPPSLDLDLDDLIGGLGGLTVEEPARETCALCPNPVRRKPASGVSMTPNKMAGAYCDTCSVQFAAYGSLQFSTKILRCLRILEDIRQSTATQPAASSTSPTGKMAPLFSSMAARPVPAPAAVTSEKPHKTIIFSQFTSFFDLLEPFLKRGRYRFVRFDGTMDTRRKTAALTTIREDDRCTVILVSIKAGSVGLNLTCCSRVILLDLWWNPAIEAREWTWRAQHAAAERN